MELKKELSLIEAFSIAAGAMISSGIFILPALAFQKAGSAIILAYGLAAVLTIPAVFSQAELGTAMPKAGGSYFFIKRSFGPLLGTFGGLANWFSLAFKAAFALVGMGIFAVIIFPGITDFQIKMVAVGFCVLFTALNLTGVKKVGRMQTYLVLVLLGILVLYSVVGASHVDQKRLAFDFESDFASIASVAGLVFISFGGLTKIASVAEEMRDPKRDLPRSMFSAFIIVSILYIIVVSITVGLLEPEEFNNSLTPLSLGASKFAGNGGLYVLAIAAMMAFITTANAGILSASRFPFAMSRDELLPRFFQSVHPRFKTPTVAITATSLFMIVVILFLSLENLVKTASTLMLLLYLLVNLSVILMRESRVHNYRPSFKSPLYPLMQIAGIIAYSALIVDMGVVPLTITSIFFGAGFVWYYSYAKMKIHHRSAFLNIMERFLSSQDRDDIMEDELREILFERDDVVLDRFDELIKAADVIDVDHAIMEEEAFLLAAKKISKKVNMGQKELIKKFMQDAGQAHTIVAPGIAIPHIRIPGEHMFVILPFRCIGGIFFRDVQKPVTTMFIIASSPDEAEYTLHALMAISQIVHSKDFEKDWFNAKNEAELRDVILLTKRKRATW